MFGLLEHLLLLPDDLPASWGGPLAWEEKGLRWADQAYAEAHRGQAVPMQDVREGLLPVGPPGVAPEEARQQHSVKHTSGGTLARSLKRHDNSILWSSWHLKFQLCFHLLAWQRLLWDEDNEMCSLTSWWQNLLIGEMKQSLWEWWRICHLREEVEPCVLWQNDQEQVESHVGSASQVQNVEERLLSVKPIGIVFRQTLQQNYEDYRGALCFKCAGTLCVTWGCSSSKSGTCASMN